MPAPTLPFLALTSPSLSFSAEPMSVILPAVRRALAQAGEVTLCVPDPAPGVGLYAGEVRPEGSPDAVPEGKFPEANCAALHRPLSTWTDLADLLGAHCWPLPPGPPGTLRLHLRAYAAAPAPDQAGYGPHTAWARVNKLEDPTFLLTFIEALRRVNPPVGGRVLALGVNAGHELEALALAFPGRRLDVLGLDLEAAALAAAQRRFPAGRFMTLDVNTLPLPELGTFDLVLALSLLQSPGVRQDVLLSALRKHHLSAGGGLILGYPNARYRDGHLSYGARMRNFERPDLSLLLSDVADARRTLQKHGYKVFVTGKYELLLTAIPAAQKTPTDLLL